MNLSLKNMDRICFVIVALCSISFGFWVITSGIRQKKQLHREGEVISAKIKEFNRLEEELKNLNKVLAVKRDRLRSFDEVSANSGGIGPFLKQLDVQINRHEIGLVSVNPQVPEKKDIYTLTPVHLVYKGSFIKTFHFLRDLEMMKRPVNLRKLTISAADADGECINELIAEIISN